LVTPAIPAQRNLGVTSLAGDNYLENETIAVRSLILGEPI